MKKLSLILILLSACLSLFSSVYYRSNEIGQKKEAVDSLEGIGFEREDIDDSVFILYLDGEEYMRMETYPSRTLKKSENRTEEKIYDEDNQLSRLIIKVNDGRDESVSEYNYRYSDGTLSGYTLSENGKVIRTVTYITDEDGRLIGIEGDSSSFFLSDGLGFEVEGSPSYLHFLPSGRLLREDENTRGKVFLNEDGSWKEDIKISDDTTSYSYSKEGRLIGISSEDESTIYEYSPDGELILKKEIGKNGITLSYYEEGKISFVEEYKGDSLSSTKRSLADGRFEEIQYENGKEKYRLIFDKDGERLMEITRL